MADTPLNGLAARLVVNQLVNEDAIRSAQAKAEQSGKTLSRQLIEDKQITYPQLALVTAEEFGIPVLDLTAFDPENVPRDLVNEKLVRKHKVMPLIKRGTRLFVAVVNPADHQAIDEIRFNTGLATEPVLVEENKIEAFIDRVIEGGDNSLNDFDDDEFENLDDLEVSAVEDAAEDYGGSAEDDAPVVKFVNKMLLSAIKGGASDLHFEPYEKSYRVRFRTDGVLHEVAKPPATLSPRIASRLKIMSAMDISERRKPQDGRIKMKLSKSKAIDFRVNTHSL